MESLTTLTFTEKIYDLENETRTFRGQRPAIVDFYADWCSPCKMIEPLLELLSTEYEGKIDFYKVDIEDNSKLSMLLGIRSIPTLLFVPMAGEPVVITGAVPMNMLKDAINKILNV